MLRESYTRLHDLYFTFLSVLESDFLCNEILKNIMTLKMYNVIDLQNKMPVDLDELYFI